MPKPILPDEQFADMTFPFLGMDLSLGYGGQRVGTTRSGVNVRAYEPAERRRRGGSRPGLTQYVPAQVDGAAHLVQHLNYIVDPSATAFVDYLPPGGSPFVTGGPNPFGGGPTNDGTYPDPTEAARNPTGRIIRFGGTGSSFVLNRSQETKKKIQWIQDTAGQATAVGSFQPAATFVSDVTQGNMLLAALTSAAFPGNGVDMTVTDNFGNSYTQIGSTVRVSDAGLFYAVSYWYCLASSLGGACTVTATSDTVNTGTSVLALSVQEYSGVVALDNSSTNTDTTSATVTTGSVPVSFAQSLVAGAFVFSTGAPVTFDGALTNTQNSGLGQGAWILDQSAPFAVTGTRAFGALAYAAIGASFRP